VFDTPTVDSLQVWKTIYICTPLLFTKTSKSPKISTMVNDCLAVRDSHQHRLQHLSPGSEGAIVACLQGYMYNHVYNIYICVLLLYIYICILKTCNARAFICFFVRYKKHQRNMFSRKVCSM
jgi:hypothetical protein